LIYEGRGSARDVRQMSRGGVGEGNGRIIYLTVPQIDRELEAAKQDQNPHVYSLIRIAFGDGHDNHGSSEHEARAR